MKTKFFHSDKKMVVSTFVAWIMCVIMSVCADSSGQTGNMSNMQYKPKTIMDSVRQENSEWNKLKTIILSCDSTAASRPLMAKKCSAKKK